MLCVILCEGRDKNKRDVVIDWNKERYIDLVMLGLEGSITRVKKGWNRLEQRNIRVISDVRCGGSKNKKEQMLGSIGIENYT